MANISINISSLINTINISNFDFNITNQILDSSIIKNETNFTNLNIDKIIINNTMETNILETSIPSNLSTNIINQTNYTNSLENNTILNNTNDNIISSNNTLKDISILNNTGNNINQTKPFLKEKIKIPLINKNMDTKYALILGISIPIILILLIIFICYFNKKKLKAKMLSNTSSNIEQNKINYKNSAKSQPYNRIQNTSGLNNNIGLNPNNLSEIKVQNMKEEMNNIISNTSGSSSGRRKREKKKTPNNNMGFEGKENQKGIQNEIKEQIKQYVIDEHNNNN